MRWRRLVLHRLGRLLTIIAFGMAFSSLQLPAEAKPRGGGRHHGAGSRRGAKKPRAHGRHGKHAPVAVPVPAAPTWGSSAEAMAAGVDAFNVGDDAVCLAAMNYVLAHDKPDPKAWYWLGRVHGRHAQYTAARDALEKFVNLMPVGRESDIASKLLHDYELLEKTRFHVESDPPGATFALDSDKGQAVTAPAAMMIPPGDHKLYVALRGYEPAVVEAKAEMGETIEVKAQLVPVGCDLSGQVLVSSMGGTLAVDDGKAATMPGPVRVKPGSHTVELTAPGADPVKQQVVCQKTEPLKVALTVATMQRGRVIVAVPPGARALIDGKLVPAEGGRAGTDLKPGDHLVDLEQEGRVPWHTAVRLHAGETIELAPTPEAGGGATGVEVTATPESATITIDDLAASSGQMLKTDAGQRRIEVRARGYYPVIRTIHVVAGERAHVEVHLVQRGRYLLVLGLAALPIAAGAEGLAILGHVNAGGELAGSAPYNRWHALEVSGHIVAGVAAATAAGSLIGWFVSSRQGDERATPRVAARPAVIPSVTPTAGGAALTLQGGF